MQEPTRSFGELVMAHKGQRICVMAGGPSLESDLREVKADVWISVNHHGAKARKVDYIVAMDHTHTKLQVPMLKHLRQFSDAPIIGPWHWNDYQIMKWPRQPKFMLSGVVATWVAALMGGHPVILAGFDCYGGDRPTIAQHKSYMPHITAEMRVCSGPLQELYPQYAPSEKRKPFKAPEELNIDDLTGTEIVVKVVKPVEFRGHEWPVGTHLRASRHEVRLQLKHRSLVEVTQGV